MSRPSRFLLAAAAVAALCLSAAASAQRFYDPPGRVARISDMRGDISYSPAGDGEWYSAHRNRPLVRGDALWSDRGARAELQVGSTWLRMDGETSVEFMDLSDRMLQVQVTEGTVSLRVRRLYPGQRVEVDTPNLALVIDRPGTFRIDVDREQDNTTIEARGIAMVYGVGGRFSVRNGDVVVFYGEDVRDYELYAYPAQDGFDRYVRMRDQRIDRSMSLRYLGDDLIGYSDLDDYGRWSRYPQYGAVWFPSNTYAGWAPYQDGQWVWQEPWGWTWVDDEPWGFAPSHYGRWAWIEGRWGWVPGPRNYRPVYAPALVAFIADIAGQVGWFPLGPSDVYYPSYNVSSNYFRSVNIANTVVSTATVNNVYNTYGRARAVPMAQGGYRNRSVPSAVTAVAEDVFVNSRPVREAARRDSRPPAAAGRGELRRELSLRPNATSVHGSATTARVRPPRAVEDEQVIVRNAPPAAAATPSATTQPSPAPAVRERPRRVRMINEQQAGVDARARGPRRAPEAAAAAAPGAAPATAPSAPAAQGAPSGRLQPLDREALPRTRGRRAPERQQEQPPIQPAPAATPAPASAPAATNAPDAQAAQAARESERQAQEARAAEQKAREERRQALEAQRAADQQQRESERALREAQQQREQAQADSAAQQQREAADAEAKAVTERQQARAAEQEAQRQQRESQQAQRAAEQQKAEAAQAQAQAGATSATPAPERPGARRDCVPQERIDAMRKRGASEERIAELKVCPAAETPPPAQP